VVSFLEKLIEVNCGENRRLLSQVGESRWILLANIFSAHGVPIGAKSAYRSSRRNTFPIFTSVIGGHLNKKGDWQDGVGNTIASVYLW
jgi:hypothetical protein